MSGHHRILHLAASTMECDVECALKILLELRQHISHENVRGLVVPETPLIPVLQPLDVDLAAYDALLVGEEV